MKDGASGAAAFVAARDFLLRHRADYDRAYGEFAWPQLGEFNWALDYFDVMAQGNDNPALWIVDSPNDAGAPLCISSFRDAESVGI